MTNIKHWHEASIRDEPSDFAGPWIYASIPINTNPLDFCGNHQNLASPQDFRVKHIWCI